ncbi:MULTISPECIES: SPOR and LysM peptidoglycan-binding domain-containing protein [unclassified Psychrobacter]|uniref:LysM peptidoglycan-binding domain-containing protein n=1 Tax=unclassified Psychrobacter TaxID=196806 RepID=UPI003FD06AAF
MNFSRQALLGIGMIVGGSVMLYAMVQQVGGDNNPEQTTAIVDTASPDTVAVAPLTTDIDTEKRLLAQKQKERAARVAEQERRAEQFLAEQETAESQALAKARAENERYRDNIAESENDGPEQEPVQETTLVTPTVQPQTIAATSEVASTDNQVAIAAQQQQERQAQEAAKRAEAQEAARLAQAQQQAKAQQQAQTDAKAKQKEQEQAAARQKQIEDRAAAEKAKSEPPTSPTDYKVKRGDGLIKLARQYNVPVAALAQANDIAPSTDLRLGQTLTIPSRKQIERLEREAAAAERSREEKRKKEEALAKKSTEAKRDAQQKLSAARQTVKETDAKGSFGVQVALAGNQAKADEVAKKFKSAGYQVKTSATSRGVRVVVGPERGKIAALALKDKVNSDPKVDTTGAWVLYW